MSVDVTRLLLAEVGARFYEAARARERARLAAASERAAEELLRVARVRLQHGDVAALDVNLAETLLARGQGIADQPGGRPGSRGLRLEGSPPPPARERSRPDGCPGDICGACARDARSHLGRRARRPAGSPAPWTPKCARRRPRSTSLGRSRWPDPTPAIRYSREEGTPIVWAGLTIPLPLLNRGSGRAIGRRGAAAPGRDRARSDEGAGRGRAAVGIRRRTSRVGRPRRAWPR